MKILLVEDERLTRVAMSDNLSSEGYQVVACSDGIQGWKAIDQEQPDVIVSDLKLPGRDGMALLEKASSMKPSIPVILMTAFATVENAIEALRLGAYDYLTKPFAPQELLNILGNLNRYQSILRENEQLRERIRFINDTPIIGNSPSMRQLKQTLSAIAPGDHTVLIEGKSGTGKEVVARTIHNLSARNSGPFIGINCCAIPESLLEGELFGYLKGAFSGAVRNHAGYFEQAENGTLFIDDIDDLPLSFQVKLLRVIQERTITRLGDEKRIAINIRLIAATKRSLKQMVAEGTFRDDLYYRLNVIPIKIPRLANRKEDIPILVNHFLKKHGASTDADAPQIDIEPLLEHSWPGNVRELENLIERIIALPGAKFELQLHEKGEEQGIKVVASPQRMEESIDLQKSLTRYELELIEWAVARAQGNVSLAAKMLKIPRSTLKSKLSKYHLISEMHYPSEGG